MGPAGLVMPSPVACTHSDGGSWGGARPTPVVRRGQPINPVSKTWVMSRQAGSTNVREDGQQVRGQCHVCLDEFGTVGHDKHWQTVPYVFALTGDLHACSLSFTTTTTAHLAAVQPLNTQKLFSISSEAVHAPPRVICIILTREIASAR